MTTRQLAKGNEEDDDDDHSDRLSTEFGGGILSFVDFLCFEFDGNNKNEIVCLMLIIDVNLNNLFNFSVWNSIFIDFYSTESLFMIVDLFAVPKSMESLGDCVIVARIRLRDRYPFAERPNR